MYYNYDNKYELLWLWYYYHTEKADLILCSGKSPDGDDDCRFPINSSERKASNMNALNNKRIIQNISGNFNMELYKYKNTFRRMKNKRIFELYEYLDRKNEFDFIHRQVYHQLDKQRKTNFIKEEIMYYDTK